MRTEITRTIARKLARYHRLLVALTLLSVVIPALYLPGLKIDNSIELWLTHDQTLEDYQGFLGRFGSDEFIVIALRMDDPFSPESMSLQREVADNLRQVPAVMEVLDLPHLADAIWRQQAGWQEKARGSRFLRNLLLGSDSNTVGLLVLLTKQTGAAGRRRAMAMIDQALAPLERAGVEFHLAGSPRMNVELDRYSAKAAAIFMPIAIGVSILVLLLVLRSLPGLVASMAAVGVGATWTMGLFAMTGRTLNMITVVLPSVLFVLGVSGAIHLATTFRRVRPMHNATSEALAAVYAQMLTPLFLSSFTTAVGFGSLMIADLGPVAEFGCFGAVGIMLMFLANILLVPGMFALLQPSGNALGHPEPPHWSGAIASRVSATHHLTLALAVVLLAGSVLLAMRIKTESNVLKFFPGNARIVKDYAYIGQKLTGFYTIEMEITCNEQDIRSLMAPLRRLERRLRKNEHVPRVDHLAKVERAYERLGQARMIGQKRLSPAGEELFANLADRFVKTENGRGFLRVSIYVNAIDSTAFYRLLAFIRKTAHQTLPPGTAFYLTGIVPLLNHAQAGLVRTQIRSFSLAALVVLAMIGILLWSWRAALAAALPNLLPVFITLAVMGAAEIALDAATVMIASVAIGIAADDTIHFLVSYRGEKQHGLPAMEASNRTFHTIGQAVIFTSLVAAAGFAFLCLADFQPLVYFGLLTSITMLGALAGDLLVLPACARVFRLWESNNAS